MNAKHDCGGPKFGRLTPGCPRCEQLAAGAAPVRWRKRDEWSGYGSREAFDAALRAAMEDARRKGTVCTFGEW